MPPFSWLLRFRPARSRTIVLLPVIFLALGGCRLEDRTRDAEGGALPAVEAGEPDRGLARPDRPRGEDAAPPPVLLLGEAFWWGEEATRAVELSVRFVSPEARRALLDPEAPVASPGGETWTLGRILVAVDYRGGPAHARWQVAGPREVVDSYLAGLRDHPPDRTPILEMGVLEMEPRRALPDGDGSGSPGSATQAGGLEAGGLEAGAIVGAAGEILGRPASELPRS
jgi:hypothetical protein